jgi:hypothetical protein
MKIALVALAGALVMTTATFSTTVPPRPLPDLVKAADHVLIGKVVNVDMVDAKGNPIVNNDARTGPGEGNVIRLHVVVEENGVLKTTAKAVPRTIVIRLWTEWHFSLGQWKTEALDKRYIFLLKGDDFQWVYPMGFLRDPSEKDEILKLLGK